MTERFETLATAAARARQTRAAVARRDEAIRQARAAGNSLRQIAAAVDLSHTQIATICRSA